MKKEEKTLRIKFAMYPGLGPRSLHEVLEEYSGLLELRKVWQKGQIKSSIKQKVLEFIEVVDDIDTQDLLAQIQSAGLKMLIWGEENYPEELAQISDPPIILYYKGDIGLIKRQSKFISVVGTRGYTPYGEYVTEEFVKALIEHDFVIVSGMAYGIDSIAHKTALKNNAKTIAVLASGANEPSPAGNEALYEEILRTGGLIFSETLPGTQIAPEFFPRRNRIIAGLSRNTLVTQAGIKSGALVTARLALEYSKNAFVIPTDITNKNIQGTNMLAFKDNAKPLYSVGCLLKELKVRQWEEKVKRKIVCLDPLQKEMVKFIKEKPQTLDELSKIFDNNYSILLASLTEMEMKKVLKQDEKGRYFYIY